MSSEEHEQFRREILKQRDKDAVKRLGLPYLVPGMSYNAVAVELRRAVKRLQVRESIFKAWRIEGRAAQQPDDADRAGHIARKLLNALRSGGERRARALHYLKTAHPHVKDKLQELAGAFSAQEEH